MIIERMSSRLRKKKPQNRIIGKNKNILHGNMAHCFDFRHRTSSFDLHDIGQVEETKSSFLAKLFRSKSDNSMKLKKGTSPGTSPKSSPKASPGAPRRRRFVRVIKNDEQVGEEYVNPHVTRKYEQGFWENKYMKKSASLDEPERPLPYTVTGQTILKKAHSIDLDHSHQSSSPASISPCGTPPHLKSCKFAEEVEVMEYDIKGKCVKILNEANITHEKLHDNPFEFCMDMELLHNPYEEKCSLKVSVEPSDLRETNYKLEALEVIDENHVGTQTNDEYSHDNIDGCCDSDSSLRDEVFQCDSSDTDSASESCDECGHEKKPSLSPCDSVVSRNTKDNTITTDNKETMTTGSQLAAPPAEVVRQSSDEGISAPKKSKIGVQSKTSAASSTQVEETVVPDIAKENVHPVKT